ncbi:MAG: rhodanese [Hydrogenophilaceae bacterium]|nr:rhodanese [Hydrogenophilaceae bacterium]
MFGLIAAVAFALPAANAVAAMTPESLAGVTLVNADKAKELQGKGGVMVDTRVANEYAEAHIKGAISVPYKEKSAKAADFDASQDSFDLSKLPADKNAVVIMYCNAGECWKSYKASAVDAKAGYKKIHWFRGGFPEWKGKGYPTE